MRHRTRFAAPFVMVVGCGAPSERAVAPVVAPADAEAVASIDPPPDAPIDAPIDAAIPPPMIVRGTANCPGFIDPTFKCPQRRDPNERMPTCNPPRPSRAPMYDVRVIAREIQGPDVAVRLAIGKRDGIDNRWHATLVTDDGDEVPNTSASVLRIDERMTVVRVRGAVPDRIVRVRLKPC